MRTKPNNQLVDVVYLLNINSCNSIIVPSSSSQV